MSLENPTRGKKKYYWPIKKYGCSYRWALSKKYDLEVAYYCGTGIAIVQTERGGRVTRRRAGKLFNIPKNTYKDFYEDYI